MKFRINKSYFVKSVALQTGGTVVAQLIPFLLYPLLRRIYEPELFGAFSVYMSISGFLAVISCFRYELTIILPKDDNAAVNLSWLSFFNLIIFTTLTELIIIIFNSQIVEFISFPKEYKHWLYFIPLSVFLYSFFNIINNWLIRKKEFKLSSLNKIVRRLFEGLTQSSGGLLKMKFGLVFGDIIGNLFNVIYGIFNLNKTGFLSYKPKIKEICKLSSKYKDFPIYNLIPAMLNIASATIPILMITKYFSITTVGYFDLTKMIFIVPSAFFAASLSSVLLQRISEKKNIKESIKKEFLGIIAVLSAISILSIFIIFFFGNEIIVFIFGEKWIISAYYSKIYIWSFAVSFVVSPLSVIFIALEKIKIVSFYQIFYFSSILSLFWFVNHSNFEQFLKIYVIIDIVSYSLYFFLIIFTFSNYEKNIKLEKL